MNSQSISVPFGLVYSKKTPKLTVMGDTAGGGAASRLPPEMLSEGNGRSIFNGHWLGFGTRLPCITFGDNMVTWLYIALSQLVPPLAFPSAMYRIKRIPGHNWSGWEGGGSPVANKSGKNLRCST